MGKTFSEDFTKVTVIYSKRGIDRLIGKEFLQWHLQMCAETHTAADVHRTCVVRSQHQQV